MKKNIVLYIFSLVVLITLFMVASIKLSIARNNYRDLDFFTLWLGGRLAGQGQNMYDQNIWVGGHGLYDSTWIENPFYVYPYPTAVFFIPLGMLPIEWASTIWIFLTLCMISISIWLLLGRWGQRNRMVFLLPIFAGAILFRPVFLTVLHGQLDGFILFLLAMGISLSEGKKAQIFFAVFPFLFLKPNLGVPILAVIFLWLFLHSEWKKIVYLVLGSSAICFIPLLAFPGWIRDFFWTTLYKGQDNNLFPNIRGLAGLVCNEQTGCFNTIWLISILILTVGLIVLLIRYKNKMCFSEVIALAVCYTLLVTPYLRAYDLILLLVPILFSIGLLANNQVKFMTITGIYLLFGLFSLILLFVAVQIGHDIYSVVLTFIATILLLWSSRKYPQLVENDV